MTAEKEIRFIETSDDPVVFSRPEVDLVGAQEGEPVVFSRPEIENVAPNMSLTEEERAISVASRDFAAPARILGQEFGPFVLEIEGDAGDGYIWRTETVPAGDPPEEENP